MDELHRVFVYGSLRRGHGNHGQMSGAVYLRDDRLRNFRRVLYDEGYPAIHASAGGLVEGEVYEVDEGHLARLDEFEGCPTWYRREEVRLESGLRAFAYVIEANVGRELPDYRD